MNVLETERMFLREPEASDVDALLGVFSDVEAMRFYPGTKAMEETASWIEWAREDHRRRGFGLMAAVLKDTDELAGQCGLMPMEFDGREETGFEYMPLKKFWGRGLATEAARACRDHAFRELGLTRLVSVIDPPNLASRRVAEKIGMKLEKETFKWGKTLCVYAVEKHGVEDGRGEESGAS